MLFRTKKPLLVVWRHRLLGYVPLLYQTRFVFIICSLFLTPSYSYTRPGLYLLYVLCSWLRPSLIQDQVCIYYMFSVLDSVLLLYQSCRFIYHNEFSFLDSVLLLYQTRLIYSHFTIILLCPTLISDRVHIFSILDSVLLLYETGFIYSLSLTPSYYYTRPGSYVVYPFLFLLVVICKTIQEKES